MKINFIIPFKRLSGGIRVVYIYANYLVSQGHDVCCCLLACQGQLKIVQKWQFENVQLWQFKMAIYD